MSNKQSLLSAVPLDQVMVTVVLFTAFSNVVDPIALIKSRLASISENYRWAVGTFLEMFPRQKSG